MKLPRWMKRLKRKLPKGMTFTVARDQSKALPGHAMMDVRIKRWYLPLFMLQGLRTSGIPRRYWPLFFWQYYIAKKWRQAHG